jgi:hypothetical protein
MPSVVIRPALPRTLVGLLVWIAAWSRSPSPPPRMGPRSAGGRLPGHCFPALKACGDGPVRSPAPSHAHAIVPRQLAGCRASMPVSLISGEAFFMMSPASSSRPTTGSAWRISPSPTSFATSTWPARSLISAGPSSPASSATRRPGSGRNWSSVTVGSHPPGPALDVGWSSSRWGWPSGCSAAEAAGWPATGTATPPRISPPGPSGTMPGSGPPSGRPDNQRPPEGKALAIARRWRNRPHERGTDAHVVIE